MEKEFKIIYQGGTGEIEEKKSRFIAHIAPVTSEEEAVAFINGKKKEFWDARHNCSAFVIGQNNEITRCNDDGEPAQTAGRPMLDVLLRENIHNCVVVVTRYFGGVLLGTGGLVRAYQATVQEGLKNCQILAPKTGMPCSISTDYNGYGKIEYVLRDNNLPILNTEFGADVNISSVVPTEMVENVGKLIADKTAGNAVITWDDEIRYDILNGNLLKF
ncbi:YigZ family protein [Pseudobutyrivibrio xylanivorans]|uniref:YigZ family protein n=1 Tax=Pseudobutyrivibrio xylanivorans TaxID=185007 RepID=A0A5P6VSM3_PSEXY|nr:YigZ family protein [Pseudobutyrivibrio xylanivorans]QFJ54719.1 YigZ family protein [Pseudobutyrivibrio xylanivorans]